MGVPASEISRICRTARGKSIGYTTSIGSFVYFVPFAVKGRFYFFLLKILLKNRFSNAQKKSNWPSSAPYTSSTTL